MIEARTRSPADGIVVLESFLAQHPGVAPARLLLGRAALLSGQWDRGLEALAPVVARSAQARLLSAQIRLAAGRDQDAARDLQALKEGWPAWSAPYAVAAAVRRDLGDCAGAIAEASAGLVAVPDAVDLLVERGVCHGAQGDLGAATRDLRAALKKDPGHADIRFELAVVLARDGNAAEALPLLLEQVARQPQHVEARAALGVAQYELGRLDDAVATLDDVVDEERSGAEAPLVLADALLSLGRDLDRALLLLERAERRAPSEVQVHAVRARVLAALGRMEEARAEAGVYREHVQSAR